MRREFSDLNPSGKPLAQLGVFAESIGRKSNTPGVIAAPRAICLNARMLSYQHIYHAGNLADVQKHALLAQMLSYLLKKDKPLTYIETHSGRGLYHLDSAEAVKTGEAEAGIGSVESWFPTGHPYQGALQSVRATHGPSAYPGSPLIAASLLREIDQMHLAELHPQENRALKTALRGTGARSYEQDGFELAQSLCPPDPRRGLLLIDPSYEIKSDYTTLPKFIAQIHRKWNVGIIALWYPILSDGRHLPMVKALQSAGLPKVLGHQVRFPRAKEGHGMVGSGMFIVNAPYGLSDEADRLSKLFERL